MKNGIFKTMMALAALMALLSAESTPGAQSVYVGHTQTDNITFEYAGGLHQYVGQLVRPNNDIAVTRLNMELRNYFGFVPINVYAEIWQTDLGDGWVQVASTSPLAISSTSFSIYSWNFASPVVLSPGHSYFVGIYDPSGSSFIEIRGDDNGYAGTGTDLNNGIGSPDGYYQQSWTFPYNSEQIGSGTTYVTTYSILVDDTVGAPVQTLNTQLPKLVFGNYPTKQPGKDSLVVVTHGWINRELSPFVPPDPTWVDSMSNSIAQYLTGHGLNSWQIYGYKWANNAWKVSAPDALYNARQEGLNLGSAIAVQGWSHVHLIGHSAGAQLIQTASEWIKSVSPTTMVQCTFLDAYVGNNGAGITNYGKGTDWSDSYFSRDLFTGSVTEACLSNAYNVDVTLLDPFKVSGISKFPSSITDPIEICKITGTSHEWPYMFYENTIVGNVDLHYEGFGFPLSKEAGNWDFAKNNYPTGNIPAHVLGVITCPSDIQVTPPTRPDWTADFTTWSTIKSIEGSVDKWVGSVIMHPNSPVWLATIVNPTNPVNTVSFDAEFVSINGSDSLLSVYWDTNVIGTADELMVQPGFQHYSLSFPNATANSTHVLGFRLDPYTNALSSVILTNVVLKQVGVSQSFSLSVTTNTFNGLLVFQLIGEPGFNYGVQVSSNLVDWTIIAILANTNGTVRFYDSDSANYNQRFYRAVVPN